jgi:hypothetical protein
MQLNRGLISGVILLFLFAVVTGLFFSATWRTPLRKLWAGPEREILSVANGKIFPDGEGRVLKIKTPTQIILEVYGPLKADTPPLMEQIVLPDKRDAQFQFRARATNLALKDLDNDNVFEIIAPSYDSALVPHLNIFRFNRDSGHFEPYTE